MKKNDHAGAFECPCMAAFFLQTFFHKLNRGIQQFVSERTFLIPVEIVIPGGGDVFLRSVLGCQRIEFRERYIVISGTVGTEQRTLKRVLEPEGVVDNEEFLPAAVD